MRLSVSRLLAIVFLGVVAAGGGCSLLRRLVLDHEFGEPKSRDLETTLADEAGGARRSRVQTVLDSRCVVCRACYDAPCQVNLTAPAGIARGGGQGKPFDFVRRPALLPARADPVRAGDRRLRGVLGCPYE